MQVKNYCKKNQIPAQDVLEVLTSQFGGTWLLTSQLNQSIVDFLNQTFQLDNLKLPSAKEQLALPQKLHSNQIDEMIANDSNLVTRESSELGDVLKEKVNQLTVSDVQEIYQQTQITDIQETALHHAVEAFQTYQSTYEEVTKSLILNDVSKKQTERQRKREEFQQKQKQIVDRRINSETSKDITDDILNLMKADDYSSNIFNEILGGL
ncbi:hypothetical protein LC612_31105 [Nostoc sp. CHAB 5834]|nr:hypothetical protein [Nostoc sp. CHAB 5834]